MLTVTLAIVALVVAATLAIARILLIVATVWLIIVPTV